jgi:catechol 2,3-dioxygenase-like lactoylglutathione lyase family enzyme
MATPILRAVLGVGTGLRDETAAFYGTRLGLPTTVGPDGVRVEVGESTIELCPAEGEPYYHVALLVPGDRFDAALRWIGERVELLPDPETCDPVFESESWHSRACYFHDPAGNIVELIAHRGIGEGGAEGGFAGAEVLGLSELGVVGDRRAAASALAALGIDVWDGTLDGHDRLAFAGERGRTLILAEEGRPWVPTGRPGEPHPVEAVVTSVRAGTAVLADSGSTVRAEAAA